jgi:hypothetical protein
MNCTQMSCGRLLFSSILLMSLLAMPLARASVSSKVKPNSKNSVSFLFPDIVQPIIHMQITLCKSQRVLEWSLNSTSKLLLALL